VAVTHASPSMIRKRTKQMAAFLVLYDPSKGKEREMIEALHRWGATRIFRGAWVIEFDSTADLARRALIAVGGAITCAIVEIKPNGDHAEIGAEPDGRDALRRFGAPALAL
jgi:hypothetical protein